MCHSLNCESAHAVKRAMKKAVIQKKSITGLSERAVRGRSRAGGVGGGSGDVLKPKAEVAR